MIAPRSLFWVARFFIVVLLSSQTSLSHAADFSLIGPKEPVDYEAVISGTCSIEMQGTVAPGDAERLAALVNEIWQERDGVGNYGAEWIDGSDTAMAICLKDSGGGDFVAGIELAIEISNLGLTTIVPAGGRCESACAVAFLGGVFPYYNEGLLPYRAMHSSSTVGFHAPSIKLKGGTVTAAAINEAYTAAARSIHSLSSLNRSTTNGLTVMGIQVSSDILNVILSTPSDEMRYIVTYSDVSVFDIVVFDQQYTMDESQVFRLCLNAMYWWRPSVFDKSGASLLQDIQLFSPKILSEQGLVEADESIDQVINDKIKEDLRNVATRSIEKQWGQEFKTVVEFSGSWGDLRNCEVHHSGFGKSNWGGDVIYRDSYGTSVNLGSFRAWHSLPLTSPIAGN